MYIDTHTENDMIASVCQALKISQFELRDQLYRLNMMAKDDDDYNDLVDSFINKKLTNPPDEILLFHLSRRLHGTEDNLEGKNLAELLTTRNAFSNILRQSGLEFLKGEHHIETFYKGKSVDWDKCHNGNPCYMKSRLGYFTGREDYCFNGFAFKDLIYKNIYARLLFNLPEFLQQLIACLGCESIEKEYMKNSSYFCYEYKIPLELVIFDGKETYSYEQKQKYLLRCTLLRIAQYQNSDKRDIIDPDNPILRLDDNYTVPAEFYVDREEVTADMLQ